MALASSRACGDRKRLPLAGLGRSEVAVLRNSELILQIGVVARALRGSPVGFVLFVRFHAGICHRKRVGWENNGPFLLLRRIITWFADKNTIIQQPDTSIIKLPAKIAQVI